MEEKTWILVANGRFARIYLSLRNGPLKEVATLGDDDPKAEPPVPARPDEMADFARAVAHHLDKALDANQFQRVYLVASPAFLGLIRGDLSPRVQAHLAGEVNKDLVHHAPEQVRENLPIVL
jgi:Protein required for attachment to host cells